MSSPSSLSLERFRLDGMMVACIAYGIYFLLTVQAWMALMQPSRRQNGGKNTEHRLALLFYVFVTFILGTICLALNIKHTQMIWIDDRNAPGGPVASIENYMSLRMNFIALTSGHISEWLMQGLLVHRCSAIWNWSRWVMLPMTTVYLVMIGCSITVLVHARANRSFYNNIAELAYLCVEIGHTVLYTILVMYRLFIMRKRMKQIMVQYDSSTYNTIALMVIESAVFYSIFGIAFIVAFAMHAYGLTSLIFLSIGKIQGISQLFIIIRVARGRAATSEWSTRGTAIHTALGFAGTVSGTTEGTDNKQIGGTERDVHLFDNSEKPAEIPVSVA